MDHSTEAQGDRTRVGRFATWWEASTPHGDLTSAEFERRHAVAGKVLIAMVPVLAVVGWANDFTLLMTTGAILPTAFFVSASQRLGRRWRSSVASFGLMSAASTLVYLSRGEITAHFIYFVLLPIVGLYQDWRPFAVAVVDVVIFHLVIGSTNPEVVYGDHGMGAMHMPGSVNALGATAVHVGFVAAQIGVIMVTWNLLETGRRNTEAALVELRDTQGQLVESMKHESIGTLAAGVAHEINTPIQFIGDNLAFLGSAFTEIASTVECPPELDDLLADIPVAVDQSIDGVRRVAEIVRSMRGFAHDGGGVRGRIDLNQAITDTVVVCRNEWRYAAEMDVRLDPDLPHPDIFSGSVKQVVLNLVVNAAHAVADRHGPDAKGRIEVVTTAADGRVHLTVSDDGAGIPDAIRERVFDQFFTTKEVGRGTGHGLAISRRVVVEQHGGRLWFESESGVGTTFHVELPIDAVVGVAEAELGEGAGGVRALT